MNAANRISTKLLFLFVFIVSGLFFSSECPAENQPSDPLNYAPNRLIIKLKTGKTLNDIKELNNYFIVSTEKVFSDTPDLRKSLAELKDTLSRLENEHERWYWQLDKNSEEYKSYVRDIENKKEELKNQISAFEKLIVHLEQRQRRAPTDAEVPDVDNTYLVKLESSTDLSSIAADFSRNSAVEYAEPDYAVKADMVPNDPYYSSSGSWGQSYADLWGLKKIQCETAWNYSQGEGVIIAVVDSGADYNHADLKDNIWINTREIAGNGKDDDKNGFVDDTKGWNFVRGDNAPLDDSYHGTIICGIIAATGNNSKGIIGISPRAKIMVVKGLNYSLTGNISDLVNAIKYAADNGADVINLSWSLRGDSQPLADAVQYAYSRGCVIIGSAGNSNESVSLYCPPKLTQVIAVASTDHNDIKSDFSNYGSKIDVSAPGGDSYDSSSQKYYINILSLKSSAVSSTDKYVVGGNYYRERGTSMSAPYVAGVAALLLSEYPDWTSEMVRRQIKDTSDTIDSLNPSYKGWMGKGRINANRAVTRTFTIAGYCKDTQGNMISGVTVRFTNLASVTTNASGYYKKTGFPNGTFTVSPYKSGYTFSSYTATVNNNNWTITFTGKRN